MKEISWIEVIKRKWGREHKKYKILENGLDWVLRRQIQKDRHFLGSVGVPSIEAIFIGTEYRSSYKNSEQIGLVNHMFELLLLHKQFSEYQIVKLLKRCNKPIQEDLNDSGICRSDICDFCGRAMENQVFSV